MKRAENGLCHASVALVFRAMSRVDGQVTLGWLERKSRQTYIGKEVSTICKHIGLIFVKLYTGDACRIQVDVAWCTAQEDEQPSKRQRCGNRAITRGLCHGGSTSMESPAPGPQWKPAAKVLCQLMASSGHLGPAPRRHQWPPPPAPEASAERHPQRQGLIQRSRRCVTQSLSPL